MLWVKALHISFMVTWFAGLFYLPRLFVYHAQCTDAAGIERFKVMERKLFYGIMTPGGLLTLALGLWMLGDYAWTAYADSGWLQVKMLLVLVLLLYHFFCAKLLNDFKHDRNHRSHVFYRWFNELPVAIMFVIIILVVVRPF